MNRMITTGPIVAILALLLAGCNDGPKFGPKDVFASISDTDKVSIADVRSKFGPEKGKQKRNLTGFLAHLAQSEGKPDFEYEYEFPSDMSLDSRLFAKTTANEDNVTALMVPNPTTPRTLDEAKKYWGEAYSDGSNPDGTYYVTYKFKNAKNRLINIYIETGDRSSTIIKLMKWS